MQRRWARTTRLLPPRIPEWRSGMLFDSILQSMARWGAMALKEPVGDCMPASEPPDGARGAGRVRRRSLWSRADIGNSAFQGGERIMSRQAAGFNPRSASKRAIPQACPGHVARYPGAGMHTCPDEWAYGSA
jgi:hypothetical protein